MNIFIIAAITADGFIAKDSSHSPMNWTSKEDKKRFVELTKQAGVVVLGSKTYSTFPKPLKDRLNIIYTHNPEKAAEQYGTAENLRYTDIEPSKLVNNLEAEGFTSIAICGGAEIYTKFINSGVVNKIFITVEPILFGTGITLFKEPIDIKLELVSTEKTELGTTFLEYNVK